MTPPPRLRLGRSRILVVLVALLVPLVSMSRLEAHARSANESDAVDALALLSRELAREGRQAASLSELMAARSIRHRLGDARRLARDVWRYHGYLFELRRSAGRALLWAWPRDAGSSGRAVFVVDDEGGIYWQPNGRGLISGLNAPPGVASPPADSPRRFFEAQGWRAWRP